MMLSRQSPICPDMLFGRDSFLIVYRGYTPRETDDRAPADPARRDQRVACACGPPELARHGREPFPRTRDVARVRRQVAGRAPPAGQRHACGRAERPGPRPRHPGLRAGGSDALTGTPIGIVTLTGFASKLPRR